MAILDDVKLSLRITHSALDSDLTAEISACKDDLQRLGWVSSKVIDSDVRVIEACKLWCKGRYDYQGKGLQYMEAYKDFRDATAMNVDYNTETNDV